MLSDFLSDPSFRQELRSLGWEDTNGEDLPKLSRLFMIQSTNYPDNSYVNGSQISLEYMDDQKAQVLRSSGWCIVQEVDVNSLDEKYPDFVANYQRGIKESLKYKKLQEAAKKRNEESAKEREAKKVQRKLNAAKKLLKSAGVLKED